MASVRERGSDVFVNLSDQLGGLVLKEEQKLAVEALSRKDVMAVLPTDFGKSIIIKASTLPTRPRLWLLFRFAVFSKTSCSQKTLV